MTGTITGIGTHLSALGLGRIPFPSTPDASCYFATRTLREELGETAHCIMARKGFVLVTGEIGLGKSTFVRRLTNSVIEDGCVVAYILNTFLRGEDLLRAINSDFGIDPGTNFADDVNRLNAFLVAQHDAGRTALIIVDDAQNLCLESLELMRMLSNFETSQEKLIQILLCGQPELVDKLADPSIRQLASRIVKHVEMEPLSLADASSYVDFRLSSAANDEGKIEVTAEALRVLHRLSGGNPRRMHLILDRCLYGLVALRSRSVSPDLVRRAAAESGIRGPRPVLRRRSTRLAMGVGIACLATAVAASVLTRQWTAPVARSSTTTASAAQPVAVATHAVTASAPVMAASDKVLQPCLDQFGLAADGGILQRDLNTGNVAAIRATVQAQQPGLAVFAMPAKFHTEQDVAGACLLVRGQRKVVIWRPPTALGTFEFGATSEPIRKLQLNLAAAGQYHYRLDGVVGHRTVAAIADFQRDHALDVTGYPDVLTRFVLAQEPGVASSRPK